MGAILLTTAVGSCKSGKGENETNPGFEQGVPTQEWKDSDLEWLSWLFHDFYSGGKAEGRL